MTETRRAHSAANWSIAVTARRGDSVRLGAVPSLRALSLAEVTK